MRVSGVEYDINWRAFTKGKSLFFPCLDYETARKEVLPVCKRLQLNVVSKGIVDRKSGVMGLRIWRV
jgi:hypothetical protein